MHRRQFMASVGLAFAATRVGDWRPGRRVEADASKRAVLASADAFGSGLTLAGGFTVVRAHDVLHGALPFVLEGEGQRFQIDVLRSTESGRAGVFGTEHFSLFVHGTGGPTQERGARMLGIALEKRIQVGAAAPMLASFDERAQIRGARLHADFARIHV